MRIVIKLNDNMRRYFEYLDALRKSGITNMFGSPPFLAQEFDLSEQEATTIVGDWMRSYSARINSEEWIEEFGGKRPNDGIYIDLAKIKSPPIISYELIGRYGTEVQPMDWSGQNVQSKKRIHANSQKHVRRAGK